MRKLLQSLKDFECNLVIYPRMTREGVKYRLSVRLYGERQEIVGMTLMDITDIESAARALQIEFLKRSEEIELELVN